MKDCRGLLRGLLFGAALAGLAHAAPADDQLLRSAPFCATDVLPPAPLKAGRFGALRLPPVAPPAKGRWFLDPAFGSCMVRVTDHSREPPEGFARNDYSRRQPFNADGSRLLVYARDGYWHLYDARSFEHLRRLRPGGGGIEPQWHPSNPDWLYVLPNNGGLRLSRYDVSDDSMTTVADFGDAMPIAGLSEPRSVTELWPAAARLSTRGEGSPSRDARYWAFQVETRDFQPLGLISYDLERNAITGFYDFATHGNGIGRPDHVSMSPRGNYVVASWNGRDVDCAGRHRLGTLGRPCGLMAFTRDFGKATGLAARGPHSDIALDANGREVIVISNYLSGRVEMVDLASGDVTPLWDIYENGHATAMHVSGKAYAKPGWVLVSTYAQHGPTKELPWYTDRIMAVELAEDPRIINIAHTFNRGDSYFSEPHAAVNRDFTRIVFNSNWGSGRETDVDTYLVRLRADALP